MNKDEKDLREQLDKIHRELEPQLEKRYQRLKWWKSVWRFTGRLIFAVFVLFVLVMIANSC